MKATFLFTFLALASPVFGQADSDAEAESSQAKALAPAADAKPGEIKKENLRPNQQAFLNLPEETRKEFLKHLGEATRVFQQKRIFETLDELDKAVKIFPDSPEIYNLRGSCFVEMRAFDKALADFEKARTFGDENPSVDFNISEVYFVTKEWKKSADLFEKVLKQIPASNTALSRLVEFKIMLCKKKLGLDAEVLVLAEKYDFQDDSPYYYYANAALAYENKDLVKAEEWLAMAGRIFTDPNVIAPWQDTMVEYGYIKSFYGEEAPPAVAK